MSKVGRNDPCPCGSGKKYKKCCMEKDALSGRVVNNIAASEFLCDTCSFDHPNSCRRPERPNATACPEYQRK